MARWLYVLLLFAPVALVAQLLGLPPSVVFVTSAISIVPLAGLIGRATEELAHHLGPQAGGLLNATFGNAAELIIAALAVNRGLLTLVKASLTGSIISNTLLILGLSLLAGGSKHGRQRYDPRHTSLNAAMMILAVAGLYLPAAFSLSVSDPFIIEELSLLVAGVLLLTYVAYLAYSVRQGRLGEDGATGQSGGVEARGQGHVAEAAGEARLAPESAARSHKAAWSVRRALLALAGAVVGTAAMSEVLVGAVEPVTFQLGLSEFFVGLIVVPLVGNAAEHFSAVNFAWRDRLEISLVIVADSSTQIALLVAPLLVFGSLALGHPMDLIFEPLELLILGLSVAIFGYISLDGESNWLEGIQLLALYLMAALVFFFLPLPHA